MLSFQPRGRSWASFLLFYGQPFSRYGQIFKISILGHETWNLKTGPKVAYLLSFYHRRSKLSLFSLYGQSFSRYGLIFKNFHIWPWNLDFEDRPQSWIYMYALFLPQGVEIKLIFALRTAIFEMRTIFQNYLIWAWNLTVRTLRRSRSFMYDITTLYVRLRCFMYEFEALCMIKIPRVVDHQGKLS